MYEITFTLIFRNISMRIAQKALTFDDVLLLPAYSNVLPHDVSLVTKLTRNININIPLLSAAMDTVTESRLAISMAQEGGLGILHKNMTIEKQANEVRKVKKFESGVVRDPITISSAATVGEVAQLTQTNKISGVPVVDGDNLVGIVTNRDLRFETSLDNPISSVMTSKEKLITVKEETSREEVLKLLYTNRIEKVLVVDNDFHLQGMITIKDIQKATNTPLASKDNQERLRIGAATGIGDESKERVDALIEAGVDIIVIDTAHGHSQSVLNQVRWVKYNYPAVQIVGGNIATGAAATALVEAGADAVKVGIGPGSICTTRIIAGVGAPQITAISNVAKALQGTGVSLIADGGIRYSGDIAKALVAGAHVIMIGGLFAGTDEAPGEMELFQGRTYKSYRGMGSLGAMQQKQGSTDRYFQDSSEKNKLVPEGIEGRVPFKGSLSAVINQLLGGIRASMGYTGSATIEDMRTKPEFISVTSAGMNEGHVHDVTITKEAPNYHRVN